jgi:hypothetical protein
MKSALPPAAATARPMPLVPPVINAVDEFVLIYEPFVRLKWLHREEVVKTLSFQLHIIFDLM